MQPSKPNHTAFIERFNKSFHVEVPGANFFKSDSLVEMAADEGLMDYNEYRPYESLVDAPPAALPARVLKGMFVVLNCPLDRNDYEYTRRKCFWWEEIEV